jgi:RecB family exonuclease
MIFPSVGTFSIPYGSDFLPWLLEFKKQWSGKIVFPTQESLDFFKKKCQLSEDKTLTTYEPIKLDEARLRHLIWIFFQETEILELLGYLESIPLDQQIYISSSFYSTVEELYNYAISFKIFLQQTEDNITATLIKKFFHFLEKKKVNFLLPTDQLDKIEKDIYDDAVSLVLIVDGQFSNRILKWMSYCSQNKKKVLLQNQDLNSFLDKPSKFICEPLILAPRKDLLRELSQPSFLKTDIPFEQFSEIKMYEESTIVDLAQSILNKAYEDNASIVTSNTLLRSLIHKFALLKNIRLKDTYGIPLSNSSYGEVFLNFLIWIEKKTDLSLLLNLILNPFFDPYWNGLPAKIEYIARLKQKELLLTIDNYIPLDQTEKKLLNELKELLLPDTFEHQDGVNFIISVLTKWGMPVDENTSIVHELAFLASNSNELLFLMSQRTKKNQHESIDVELWHPDELGVFLPKSVIVADLNEGEWPATSSSTAFELSKEFRQKLGVPLKKNESNLSSKKLLGLIGLRKVYLYRCTQDPNGEKNPSRWWERLKMISNKNRAAIEVYSSNSTKISKLKNDQKKINKEDLPSQFSIPDIVLLLNNPELFIERSCFKIRPLAELLSSNPFHQLGKLLHKWLGDAVESRYSYKEALEKIDSEVSSYKLGAYDLHFLKSQITKNLRHFYDMHAERDTHKISINVKGKCLLETEVGIFELTGKIDRIEYSSDGSVSLIDYRTGMLPSNNSICSGEDPTLFLMGYIAKNNGFVDRNVSSTPILEYWGITSKEQKSFLFSALESPIEKISSALKLLILD